MRRTITNETRPEWPWSPNIDSPQHRGLLFWMAPALPGARVVDAVIGRPATLMNCLIEPAADGDGLALAMDSSNDYADFGDSSFLPTQGATVAMWMRKRDATNRASAAFTTVLGGDDTRRFLGLVPYSDGVVYFDFGGFGEGTNRLSKSGLTVSGTNHWVFTAGARGMEIWQNGVRVASNAANPTRSSTTGSLILGDAIFIAGDVVDYYDFRIWDHQLPESVIDSLYRPETRWELYKPDRVPFYVGEAVAGSSFQAAWARGSNVLIGAGVAA